MTIKRILAVLIALFLVLIAILASTTAYFYFQNKDGREELEKNRLQELERKAFNVYSELVAFIGKFDYETWQINQSLRQYTDNETKVFAIAIGCRYLRSYAYDTYRNIEDNLRRLEWLDEEHRPIYVNVSETVEAALGQVGWATRGKTSEEILNETPQFLWELYDLFNISQLSEIENLSQMNGIAYSFKILSFYWSGTTWTPPLQTIVNWVQRNNTAFHQRLIQWEEYRNPVIIPG